MTRLSLTQTQELMRTLLQLEEDVRTTRHSIESCMPGALHGAPEVYGAMKRAIENHGAVPFCIGGFAIVKLMSHEGYH